MKDNTRNISYPFLVCEHIFKYIAWDILLISTKNLREIKRGCNFDCSEFMFLCFSRPRMAYWRVLQELAKPCVCFVPALLGCRVEKPKWNLMLKLGWSLFLEITCKTMSSITWHINWDSHLAPHGVVMILVNTFSFFYWICKSFHSTVTLTRFILS